MHSIAFDSSFVLRLWDTCILIQSHSNHKHSVGFPVLMSVEHLRIHDGNERGWIPAVEMVLKRSARCVCGQDDESKDELTNRTKSWHSIRNDKMKTRARLNLTFWKSAVELWTLRNDRPISHWNTFFTHSTEMEEANDARASNLLTQKGKTLKT